MEAKVTCAGDQSDKWEGGRMARTVKILNTEYACVKNCLNI